MRKFAVQINLPVEGIPKSKFLTGKFENLSSYLEINGSKNI